MLHVLPDAIIILWITNFPFADNDVVIIHGEQKFAKKLQTNSLIQLF